MPDPYPEIEPYAQGMLEVTGGDLIYWEVCGNPRGKPAVVLHGGPGSGCTPWHRRLFDPAAYRVVLFDQRGCGRSRPQASSPETELSENTTGHLIADIELLRVHLNVERWLVLGGSWGSALALAYAERFPTRVTELILFGVTTGRREEFDWLFRDGLGAFFPEEWERRRSALPVADRDGDTVEAYCRLLQDSDPAIRAPQGDVMPDQQLMRAVLELDLAAYADVARVLEENLDVWAVNAFEDQIQSFVDHADRSSHEH